MEFLRFLAFVAVWGFMWRWVVKNRGSWNIFYGNIVGAAGGFIVGLVMLSITFRCFLRRSITRRRRKTRQSSSRPLYCLKPRQSRPPPN